MSIALRIDESFAPLLPLAHLDDLWFQVAGTVCNLACRHCFISCGPRNHSLEFLTLDKVRQALDESAALGVKEYYFTGGEPFLNPDIEEMLEATLWHGPATVLTNGTLFTRHSLERLRRAEENSLYTLEFRVSIDGYTGADNDRIRGEGSFERAMAGIRLLLSFGFLPIVTITDLAADGKSSILLAEFTKLLRAHGCSRPRVKILPTLRMGAEIVRSHGYGPDERITASMMEGFDSSSLLCHHSRIVTDRGVYVCPILVEATDGLLGASVTDALGPFRLRHQACFTCYQHGAICANPSSEARDA
jgi:molybdenum cofactor biosynthesis enzyme MoaA